MWRGRKFLSPPITHSSSPFLCPDRLQHQLPQAGAASPYPHPCSRALPRPSSFVSCGSPLTPSPTPRAAHPSRSPRPVPPPPRQTLAGPAHRGGGGRRGQRRTAPLNSSCAAGGGSTAGGAARGWGRGRLPVLGGGGAEPCGAPGSLTEPLGAARSPAEPGGRRRLLPAPRSLAEAARMRVASAFFFCLLEMISIVT